jgi:NADH:ubiquinone oxidoreductase subunit 3 (subunit A)
LWFFVFCFFCVSFAVLLLFPSTNLHAKNQERQKRKENENANESTKSRKQNNAFF